MRLFPGYTYSKFLLWEFIKVFFVTMVFIMGLSFIVRTLQNIESTKAYSFLQVLVMRALEAPQILSRESLLPACMFASVYTMSLLSKNRELLSLRSCGVSVYRIISPLIFLGLLITVSSLFFEDYIVVKSFQLMDGYKALISGEKPKTQQGDRSDLIVFGENNIIYQIDRYISKSSEMQGVMIIQKDAKGGIGFRIDAPTAKWNGKEWVFYNGLFHSFDKDGGINDRILFSELYKGIKDDPEYFGRETRSVENMTLKEGYTYISIIRKMGFQYKGYLTRFHRKIANPVTLFLVTLMGLSLGSMAFKNTFVISFSMTLGIVLLFFFIIEIGYTFGNNGIIPPAVGGWLGNIVFLFPSIYLLKKVRV